MILGMSRAQIAAALDAIVEFADIGRYIDEPVKYYSSGMYLRLAFSVSAHLDAEILLIDEVLSVGDAAFQEKCLERILDLVAQGRTVLFVSHSMDLVLELCDAAMVLDRGRIAYSGDTHEAVAKYGQLVQPS